MKLCVIVPAKDESIVIGETISSLLQAGVEPQDIYVIDDGSSDNTGAIALAYGSIVLRNEKNVGKAKSIERVVEYFKLTERYDLISLMDADTRVAENYFNSVKESFQDLSVTVVCGQPKSRKYNWLTAYRCYSYFMTCFVYRGAQSKLGVINVAPGCATTYRTTIFNRLDWNNDTIVEDMDVTVQVHRKELGKITYQHNAIVHTQDPRTVQDYTKQMYRWNIGTWQVVKKYKMFTGLKKLDFEYKFLLGEGLFFSLVYISSPFLLMIFQNWIFLLVVDMLITACIALFISILERRLDVFIFSPLYPIIRFIDCVVFLYSFWTTIIIRKKISTWFAVKRYDQYNLPQGASR